MFKARLVAQGFRQVQGVDYGETFSHVVRYESIPILFAIAAQFKLTVHEMDVTTAFLNGDLQEEMVLMLQTIWFVVSVKVYMVSNKLLCAGI